MDRVEQRKRIEKALRDLGIKSWLLLGYSPMVGPIHSRTHDIAFLDALYDALLQSETLRVTITEMLETIQSYRSRERKT